MEVGPALAALTTGYVIGSIPFGLILTRLAGMGDLRSIGSGNIGATNVLRTGNRPLAAATLVLDAFKGTVSVLSASWLFPGTPAGLLAGVGAFCGHCFPVWLNFRGGKGVATYVGILAAVAWPFAVLFGAAWIITAFVTRYSSVSALVATALTPVALWIGGHVQAAGLFALLTVVSWAKHHQNISRLVAGSESRIGSKG